MHLIESLDFLNEIIQQYFKKNTITNNFLLPDAYTRFISQKRLFFIASESNACILLKKAGFFQLYYFLNDEQVLIDLDAGEPVTMEILYRGEAKKPYDVFTYWEKCGFKQHLSRDNMVASFRQIIFPKEKPDGILMKYAEKQEEILFTKKLFDNALDKYTGDMLTLEEIQAYSQKKQLICAYYKGELAGALQFEIKNNVVWLGHIVVANNFRGKGIANELVKTYIADNVENENTRYQLWVIQNNIGAVNLYRKFGFVYGNKSSASMLKV